MMDYYSGSPSRHSNRRSSIHKSNYSFLELTDADKNTASDNCHQQKDQKKNWNAVMLTPSSAKRIV